MSDRDGQAAPDPLQIPISYRLEMSARELVALIGEGLSCLASVFRKREATTRPLLAQALTLGRALRPHFFALPAGAALAGGAAMPDVQSWRVAIAAGLAGIGWGVGQLVNDLLDREADSIDAPDRPAVRGALPEGPTMLFAMLLGLAVAAITAMLHPAALWLAGAAALLLLGYGPAKRVPLAGNLAHGALQATATLIGAAAGAPSLPLARIAVEAAPTAAVVGGWAMVYLESNYEKDRRGDRIAGYRTLPHVIGLRASAGLRAVGAVALVGIAHRQGLFVGSVAFWVMTLALILVVLSSSSVILAGTEQAALGGYRASVHAAALGMIALGAPILGNVGTLCLAGLNGLLVERAFSKSRNP